MQAVLFTKRRELRDQFFLELQKLEIEVVVAEDIKDVQNCCIDSSNRLIIGDWWLDDLDDLTWCKRVRKKFSEQHTVILIATDRREPRDLEKLLDAGADDYFLWPTSLEVLSLRLRIAIQRARARVQREQIERKLRDSVERFELAVQGANDGLWDALTIGKDWHRPDTVVWYSARFKQLLGYSDDEFPNLLKSWESRLHPEDRDRIVKTLTSHMTYRTPYDVEYRLLTKSGQYRWFSARGQAIWDETGQVMRMAGSLRDITQAKEYEAKLEQSEEKWRSLVENAPEIVLLTDPDGIIRFINRDRPFAQEAVGRSVYDYVGEEHQKIIRSAFESLIATGEPQSYEVQSQTEDGGQAWYAARVGPIWEGGRIASVVLVATNITQRKIAEDQLQRERNSLRRLLDLQERERRLVSYEIHDGLVQYLTAGIMHLEASASCHDLTQPQARADYERAVALLRESLAEGRRLISGLRPPILDERGVIAALEYLVNEFHGDIPVLQFHHHAHCGRLAPTLEVAIFRIAQEALSNIRKHSEAKRAQMCLLQHGEWLRLMIKDWGKGFDLSKVREDSFGLQGIRQRARLLGTRAIIDSLPNQGTTIVVDFPIVSKHSVTDNNEVERGTS